MRVLPVLAFAGVFALAAPLAAETVDVGEHGATLEIGPGWERKVFTADLGKDQFIHEDNNFTVVMELPILLDRREDFTALLDSMMDRVQGRLEDVRNDEGGFLSADGLGRATRRFTGRIGSLDLAYRMDVIGRDGLAYLVMTWGPRSAAEQVYAYGAGFAGSLRMPGPDSEWGKSTLPTPRSVQHEGWTIGFSYPRSLWNDLVDKGDAFFGMSTAEENLMFMLLSNEVSGPDAMLDGARDALGKAFQGVRELERTAATVSGQPARRAVVTGLQEGVRWDFLLLAVPLGEQRVLDIRVGMRGPFAAREPLVRGLIDSLTLTPPRQVDAFPRAAAAAASSVPAVAAAPLPTPVARLLAGAERLGALGGTEHLPLPGGGLLSCGYGKVSRTGPDGAAEGLWNGSSATQCAVGPGAAGSPDSPGSPGSPGSNTGEILVAIAGGEVQRLKGRELEPLGFSAAHFAGNPAGGLVLVRTVDATVDGLADLPGTAQLIARAPDGAERTVATLAGLPTRLAVDGAGRRALVAVVRQTALGRTAPEAHTALTAVDLASGKTAPLGDWQSVSHAVPAAGGWLVNGEPDGRPEGLYLLDGKAEPRLLIAGDGAKGVALADGEGGQRLTFATTRRQPGDPAPDGQAIAYRAPLAAVLAEGPAWQPFDAGRLREIAAAALAEAKDGEPLTRRAGLDRLLAAADAAAVRLAGATLPTAPAEVDELFGDAMGEHDLGPDTVTLLAAVLARSLLAQGAVWVDGPAAPLGIFPDPEVGDNDLAVAFLVPALVTSTLYVDEGWWNPATGVPDQAKGRTLLIGADRTALAAALRAAEVPKLAALAAGGKAADRAELARELEARAANTHLRGRVYRELAAGGRLQQLADLAGAFAGKPEAGPEDRRAWYAARFALSGEAKAGAPPALPALIEELRAAIAAHPDEPALYLLLGKAYLAAGGPEAADLARACFEQIEELEPYGADATAAEAAIAELEGEEG
jgi:hypothetical protein